MQTVVDLFPICVFTLGIRFHYGLKYISPYMYKMEPL